MTELPDPWDLPGPDSWLGELAERLASGLLLLPAMATAPPGLVAALLARCPGVQDRREISSGPGETRAPAALLGEAICCPPTLEALASPGCDRQLVILRLAPEAAAPGAAWPLFLRRFAEARRRAPGLCLLLPEAPAGLCTGDLPCASDWRASLSRGDRVIWAEEHLPRGRTGLAAELAVALAVELCVWRLDLAAALARAGTEDLLRPLDWLARRREGAAADAGGPEACPLALLQSGRTGQLRLRLWRAQLMTFFPALEELRLDFIGRHRGRLRLDAHLRALGVGSVDEIELGALCYQLRGALRRQEADRLEALARLRNRLAHRQPGEAEDCRALLEAAREASQAG